MPSPFKCRQPASRSVRLDALEVSVNGAAFAMSDWRTKSVRDLFFYFLFMQEAVTKEQIGEVIWPRSKILRYKAAFKDEIYRLRRAVGRNAITFDDEVYYLFNRDVGL